MDHSKETFRTRTGREVSIQKHDRLLKNQFRSSLRKLWSRFSRGKEECLRKARREYPRVNSDGRISKKLLIQYRCQSCKNNFKESEIQVDHVLPVGKTPNIGEWSEWGTWLSKLFCNVEDLQALCLTCHSIKTKKDRSNIV